MPAKTANKKEIESLISKALDSVKFCFEDNAKVNKEELEDFKRFMIDLVDDIRKKEFFAGYQYGAADLFSDLSERADMTEFVYNAEQATGMHDRWQEWDR